MTRFEKLKAARRVVVKVGTSSLTHPGGKLNLKRLENIAKVLSDLKNGGKEIVLVTSGAIGVGMGRLGLDEKPVEVSKKQALAAIGQSRLMAIYDKFFAEFGYATAQVLLTKNVLDEAESYQNIVNSVDTMLDYGVIPIVNENDVISTYEIQFGDNDALSAHVARFINADLLVIWSDIDGLYDANPADNPSAAVIPVVDTIDGYILSLGGAAGTSRGTGGMATKLAAAQIAAGAGIDMVITNGARPDELYALLDGKPVGTLFCGRKGE